MRSPIISYGETLKTVEHSIIPEIAISINIERLKNSLIGNREEKLKPMRLVVRDVVEVES